MIMNRKQKICLWVGIAAIVVMGLFLWLAVMKVKVTLGWTNETALYYVYSTIAQTLAGAFGILGAFTLFHLQGIHQSIKGTCSVIYNSSSNPSGLIRLPFLREDWRSFLDNLNNYQMSFLLCGIVTIDKELYELLKCILKSDLEYRKAVIKNIKAIIYLTAVAITLSLIALPLVPKLVRYARCSGLLLSATTVISIGCVYYYTQIISRAINYKIHKVDFQKTKAM
ncbi:hypothetical protein ES708_15138 [subsurface metagenome]